MPKAKSVVPAKKTSTARKTTAAGVQAGNGGRSEKVKQIAGVKVPKDLREVAAAAQRLMENPIVRDVVAAGALAAMAAFAEAQQRRQARTGMVGDAAEEAGRNAQGLKKTAKVVAGAAAGAMGKKLMEEVKARGPELIAKLDVTKSGAGETRLDRSRREREEQEEAETA
jgi:hypothetical protein